MISGWSIVTFVRSSTYQRNAFYIHKLNFLIHSNDKEELYSNKVIATQITRKKNVQNPAIDNLLRNEDLENTMMMMFLILEIS